MAIRGPSESRAAEDVSQCSSLRANPVYRGLGYDHLVEVENRCSRAVRCELWTDVDPEPKHLLRVAAGQTGSVVTRRGSPARQFAPQGACRF